jgi:hypothetical protein
LDIIARSVVISRKKKYITAKIQFTLHGAEYSGCNGHSINEAKTSIVHTIKIIGII